MIGIINAAFSRPRTVLLLLALILIAGTYSYMTIPKESDPDIDIPIIYVLMTHEGISPGDAERLLVRPMEQELRGIDGVKEITSKAYEGGANVTLEFDAGFDPDIAIDDVRAKVDLAKPELPEETDEPSVHEVNLSLFPILVVTLSGDVPERTLLRLARDLQDEIEGLSEVLEANIQGERDELVEIVIDPMLVESYGLEAAELIDFVGRSNRLVAAGSLDTGAGRFSVKVPGLLEGAADLLALPVKVEGDAITAVSDIAEVRRTFKDPESFARVSGDPALAIEVSKRTGENIIATIENVRAVVDRVSVDWPAGVEIAFSHDQSNDIRNMLTDLQNNVLSAILLVMIVIVWALGWRTAALVGVAIPGSFLTGILVLWAAGLTMNIVVLFSLILAVGMLVDGAIVVTEYADRKMAEGLHRGDAYLSAATRMAWPITASTMTTLAAFLPLMFWPGVVGEFMKFLPLTLIATLLASLTMALVFVPTLGSLVGKSGAADPERARALAAGAEGNVNDVPGFTGVYLGVLHRALRHPAKVLGLAVAVLIGVMMAYGTFGKGVEFFPNIEPEQALFQIHARGNLSVWEKDTLVREVEDRILDMREFETIYATVGGDEGGGGQDVAEDVIGSISVELIDWEYRRPAEQIFAEVLERTSDLAGIIVEPTGQQRGPAEGKPIEIKVLAIDPDLIEDAVATIREHMDTVEGLRDIEDSRPLPGIQWEIEVDRAQAAKFGTDVSSVGGMVQLVTNGLLISTIRPDDSKDEIEVRARFSDSWRTLDQLDNLRIQTPIGHVPLANFVTRSAAPQVDTINRTDGVRVMTIKSDIEEGVLADAMVQELSAWIETAGLDPRVNVEFRGENEDQAEAAQFLMKAFGVALFLMTIILVTQFNSFYFAFLILSAVIMSTIGVMIGLLVTGQPFSIVMSGIGVIALAGIVVNNNIVLIDTYDRLRQTIRDPMEAILRTGAQRLRPVMLTTITTILGLMPMVMQVNIDFFSRHVAVGAPSTQWWVQLSSAIVFGLAFATMLTLIVTPSALMLRENVQGWWHKRRGPEPAGRTRPRRRWFGGRRRPRPTPPTGDHAPGIGGTK
ncbi:MAG: efflux RND transporter permease subunit [Rhodospirillales bacterium]|nr:efflux RND transporter permease subunit [Rhodospirillales bacterium]